MVGRKQHQHFAQQQHAGAEIRDSGRAGVAQRLGHGVIVPGRGGPQDHRRAWTMAASGMSGKRRMQMPSQLSHCSRSWADRPPVRHKRRRRRREDCSSCRKSPARSHFRARAPRASAAPRRPGRDRGRIAGRKAPVAHPAVVAAPSIRAGSTTLRRDELADAGQNQGRAGWPPPRVRRATRPGPAPGLAVWRLRILERHAPQRAVAAHFARRDDLSSLGPSGPARRFSEPRRNGR